MEKVLQYLMLKSHGGSGYFVVPIHRPPTTAEFQIHTSTCLQLLQELSLLPLLNCLFQCKAVDFIFLFYYFGVHLVFFFPFYSFFTGRVPRAMWPWAYRSPGKEMLIPRGWEEAVLWCVGIYLKNHSLVRATQ